MLISRRQPPDLLTSPPFLLPRVSISLFLFSFLQQSIFFHPFCRLDSIASVPGCRLDLPQGPDRPITLLPLLSKREKKPQRSPLGLINVRFFQSILIACSSPVCVCPRIRWAPLLSVYRRHCMILWEHEGYYVVFKLRMSLGQGP